MQVKDETLTVLRFRTALDLLLARAPGRKCQPDICITPRNELVILSSGHPAMQLQVLLRGQYECNVTTPVHLTWEGAQEVMRKLVTFSTSKLRIVVGRTWGRPRGETTILFTDDDDEWPESAFLAGMHERVEIDTAMTIGKPELTLKHLQVLLPALTSDNRDRRPSLDGVTLKNSCLYATDGFCLAKAGPFDGVPKDIEMLFSKVLYEKAEKITGPRHFADAQLIYGCGPGVDDAGVPEWYVGVKCSHMKQRRYDLGTNVLTAYLIAVKDQRLRRHEFENVIRPAKEGKLSAAAFSLEGLEQLARVGEAASLALSDKEYPLGATMMMGGLDELVALIIMRGEAKMEATVKAKSVGNDSIVPMLDPRYLRAAAEVFQYYLGVQTVGVYVNPSHLAANVRSNMHGSVWAAKRTEDNLTATIIIKALDGAADGVCVVFSLIHPGEGANMPQVAAALAKIGEKEEGHA